jgi:hypothetical protein
MCATASPRGVGVEVGACCLGRASQQPTRRVAGWWTATQLLHASSSACTADGGRHTAHCCKPYRRPASARRVRLLATVPPIEGLAVQVYRHCSCCTTAVRVLLFASVGSWPQLYVLTAEPAGRGGSMHSCIYATRIFPQIGVGSGSRLLALLAVGQEYLHPADAILLGPLQYLFIRNY